MANRTDTHKISAPASLVFEKFLDTSSWHQWSQSIVNAKVAHLDIWNVTRDELTWLILQKTPREQHEDPMEHDLIVNSTLKPGSEATLSTIEDPRQPQQITTLRLIVNDISYPLTHSKRKKISMLEVPASSHHVSSVDSLRLRKPSIPQRAPTGLESYQKVPTSRPSTPELELCDQFPSSFIITYSVEKLVVKTRTSSFSRWFPRQASPNLATYTSIITPQTPTSCSFATLAPSSVPEKVPSQARFFDKRFNFKPRRLSEPIPDPAAKVIPSVVQIDKQPPPAFSWIKNLPRELGGYSVRCFSELKLSNKMAEKHFHHLHHRNQFQVPKHVPTYDHEKNLARISTSESYDSLSPLHSPSRSRSRSPTKLNPSLKWSPPPKPNRGQGVAATLPRSDSSAISLAIRAQHGDEDCEDMGMGNVAVSASEARVRSIMGGFMGEGTRFEIPPV